MTYESTDHMYKKNANLNDTSQLCTNIGTKCNKVKELLNSCGEELCPLTHSKMLCVSQHIFTVSCSGNACLKGTKDRLS